MAAHHTRCAKPGRFDCATDEKLYEHVMDEAWEGDVESPQGAFLKLDLVGDDELHYVVHYGTPHLLLRQTGQGFVHAWVFDTEEGRDTLHSALSAAYEEWSADDED